MKKSNEPQRSYRPLRVEVPKDVETYGGRVYYMHLDRPGKPKVYRQNSIAGTMLRVTSPVELAVCAEWARKTVDAKKALIEMQKKTEAAAAAHQLRLSYRLGRWFRLKRDAIGRRIAESLEVFNVWNE